jgi:hypothetical protein
MSIIIDKGAIRSCLSCIGDLPYEMTLFEIIDNREHSKSKSVFIDFDMHNKKITIGYSNAARKDQIDNMVRWYNVTNTHYEGSNIATRASGMKLFEYTATGEYSHISRTDKNTYYESFTNTSEINKSLKDRDISNKDFSETLHRETQFAREKDNVIQVFEDIINNNNNLYPFSPKTIISVSKISNNDFLSYIKNVDNQDALIKKFRIKHYSEIFNNDLELYIKFPNKNFNKVDIHGYIDVIGNSNNYVNKHNTQIYISKDDDSRFYLEHNNMFYTQKKNGNSILRQKLEDNDKINAINKEKPDFILEQYNTKNISNEEKKKSIIGSSLEHYAGLYINIGDVFISCEKSKWNVTDRNLSGSKNYRCVLKINSDAAKSYIGLNGLKSLFDLTTKPELHKVIKGLTDIYKKYINCGKPLDPDKYFIVESSAQKSEIDKKLEGYFYICNVGKDFYKLGIFTNRDRIFDYNNEKNIDVLKNDFKEENIYEKPTIILPILDKIPNIKLKEQEIKCFINDSENCITYDANIGEDIREYFHCNNFYEYILPEIKRILEN